MKDAKQQIGLEMLLSLIARGVEYPDAEYTVMVKLNLDGYDLYQIQLAYDNL